MAGFTNQEKADMHFMYGTADGNIPNCIVNRIHSTIRNAPKDLHCLNYDHVLYGVLRMTSYVLSHIKVLPMSSKSPCIE